MGSPCFSTTIRRPSLPASFLPASRAARCGTWATVKHGILTTLQNASCESLLRSCAARESLPAAVSAAAAVPQHCMLNQFIPLPLLCCDVFCAVP